MKKYERERTKTNENEQGVIQFPDYKTNRKSELQHITNFVNLKLTFSENKAKQTQIVFLQCTCPVLRPLKAMCVF